MGENGNRLFGNESLWESKNPFPSHRTVDCVWGLGLLLQTRLL